MDRPGPDIPGPGRRFQGGISHQSVSGNAAKTERGFTLIELLVVIVILGVVAAIVVFAVGSVTDRGKASACKTDVKNVVVAEEAYYSQFRAYTTIDDLVVHNLLRGKPSASSYNVNVDTATGEVTSTPSCSSL
jgi:general secretion pathway protein G